MADSFKLTDGTTEIELIYDAGNTYKLKQMFGATIASMEPRPVWHNGDDTAPVLIDTVPQNRNAVFSLMVKESTDDDNANTVIVLRRMLAQAERYHTQGIGAKVYLAVKLTGATYETRHDVVWGTISDESQTSAVSRLNTIIFNLRLRLTLAPFGYSEVGWVVRNDLASSAHFLNDSNADGLADGWSLIATPTCTIDTTYYLTGGKSQKIEVDASTQEAIYSDSVSSGGASTAVAYAWVTSDSAADDVLAIRLYDNSGLLITVLYDPSAPANYERTKEDSTGKTWYKYKVAETLVGINPYLWIGRLTGDATIASTYYVDTTYLELDSLSPPPPYISTSAITNRNDTTATNEGYINYIDILDIPGDAPAHVQFKFDYSAAGSPASQYIQFFRSLDGQIPVGLHPHWLEDDQLAFVPAFGSMSTPADGTRSDGTYERVTTSVNDTITVNHTFASAAIAREFFRRQMRVLVIARTSDVTKVTLDSDYGRSETLNTNDTWEVVDMGIYGPFQVNEIGTGTGTSNEANLFQIKVTTSTSETVDIDAVLIMYGDGMFVANYSASASLDMYADSELNATHISTLHKVTDALGVVFTLEPGPVTNRIIYAPMGTNNTNNLGDTMTVTATITPRTRGLAIGDI